MTRLCLAARSSSRVPKDERSWLQLLESLGARCSLAGPRKFRLLAAVSGSSRMPFAVRQGRQRRDAAAEGKEQLGRCATAQRGGVNITGFICTAARKPSPLCRRPWPRGGCATAGACFNRFYVACASRAQNLGVGIRQLCRGRAFGGMLGAMARIALARPAAPPSC